MLEFVTGLSLSGVVASHHVTLDRPTNGVELS